MRLFVALWPPVEVLRTLGTALTGAAGSPGATAVRWSATAQLHITLAFLGEVEPVRQEQVERRLARVAGRHPPLDLHLAGAGRFGDRVLFVTVGGDREGLKRLAGSVAAAARHAGVPIEERGFRAHLTVGRARGGDARADLRPLVAALDAYRSAGWTAADLHLVHSRPGAGDGGRAAYSTVASWPLTRADG
ncbi:MAG TPA: RNA 2',3'-cyclic phosphodiesterase [Kineosporiaceae bacterium]